MMGLIDNLQHGRKIVKAIRRTVAAASKSHEWNPEVKVIDRDDGRFSATVLVDGQYEYEVEFDSDGILERLELTGEVDDG